MRIFSNVLTYKNLIQYNKKRKIKEKYQTYKQRILFKILPIHFKQAGITSGINFLRFANRKLLKIMIKIPHMFEKRLGIF